MKTKTKIKSNAALFQEACVAIETLNYKDLLELRDILEAFIEIKEPVPEANSKEPDVNASKRSSDHSGHLEYKYIRGFGPYAYLRYWSGGKLKSQYLGKRETLLSQMKS